MNRRFILRYLILITFLAICAGAAWYMTGTPRTHAADTVLAGRENPAGKYVVLQKRPAGGERYAEGRFRSEAGKDSGRVWHAARKCFVGV